MSAIVVVAAVLAGAVGALLRYGTTLLFARLHDELPWAVLAVNTVGSLIGGIVLGLVTTGAAGAAGADIQLIVVGGLAGGLTTFSTFSVETMQLALAGRWRIVVATVGANLALGVGAAVLGFAVVGGFS
ncbi:MAG: CrcB family protein [Pseudolysinimonas sp.]